MPNTTYDKQQADALAFIKSAQLNWDWSDQDIADYVDQFPDNPQTKVIKSFLDLDEEVLRVTTHSVRKV
jgi:hypothetical protein